LYRWWGGRFGEPEKRLSILDLVNSGSVDLRLAGFLWLLMKYRASVVVAAGPSYAGKTTTLNAILDFLDPTISLIALHGNEDNFEFTKTSPPSKTYLVAEEFNYHLDYVWGDTAQKAFELISEGYGLGGTLHARTAKEAVLVLHNYFNLSVQLISSLDAIVILNVIPGWRRDVEIERRIESITLVSPTKDSVALQIVAAREMGKDSFVLADDQALQTSMAKKFDIRQARINKEIEIRQHFLARLLLEGKTSREEVRRAIIEFYRSHPS
jgi:hypothetical protein